MAVPVHLYMIALDKNTSKRAWLTLHESNAYFAARCVFTSPNAMRSFDLSLTRHQRMLLAHCLRLPLHFSILRIFLCFPFLATIYAIGAVLMHLNVDTAQGRAR
jgi:hypothetical protein